MKHFKRELPPVQVPENTFPWKRRDDTTLTYTVIGKSPGTTPTHTCGSTKTSNFDDDDDDDDNNTFL
jgi:hypothetical protein